MNAARIVKASNTVALLAVAALTYWVFIFLCITIFDFSIFKENVTTAFFMSVVGIFSLLMGAIILNVMLNLTRIAEQGAAKSSPPARDGKSGLGWPKWVLLTSFPVIFLLLWWGDIASTALQKQNLLNARQALLEEQHEVITQLAEYRFDAEYIHFAARQIKILSRIDKSFPQISLIVRDKIDGKEVFLAFTGWQGPDEEEQLDKTDYIFATTAEERAYLKTLFDGNQNAPKFHADESHYSLFYPVRLDGKTMVLLLSDYQRYGQFSS